MRVRLGNHAGLWRGWQRNWGRHYVGPYDIGRSVYYFCRQFAIWLHAISVRKYNTQALCQVINHYWVL
jgi:hypothetical protein